MLSRAVCRASLALGQSSRRPSFLMKIYPLKNLPAHPGLYLSTSCPRDGKNVYYGFTQKENQRHGVSRWYVWFILGATVTILFAASDIIEWLGLDVEGRETISDKSGTEDDSSSCGEQEEDTVVEGKKKRKKTTFKEKKVMEYENRIRNYSTPDKIFRYFATLKVKQGHSDEIFMTPEDFVRSLMPGSLQPEEYGLDKFRRFDPKVDSLSLDDKIELREGSIFYHLEKHGLISFSDYILLLTLLSTPPKQFELAFKMFDHNGDGNLDRAEYEKVQAIIRSRTTVGQRHRDHANTGNVIKPDVDGALSHYFFGPNLDEKLSYQKFIGFHRDIHDEVLWIEFHKVAELEGDAHTISERDFAHQILMYAGFSDQKRISICKRIRKEFKKSERGITYKEYYDFAQVLKSINEIDTALTFYHVAGAAIDKTTFKHVAKTVAKVQMTDHLVDVVFAIFDENNDERLSNKEFVSVMKRRLMRGLERPRETGFAKMFAAVSVCSRSMANETWHRWTSSHSGTT
ncbi:calcium uptake protein 1, mitochondrial-like isoform X2 [Watersipora subatra]|uniref:calcium uptake protein 1, mitochondrial-like isoform X2 n=1 Tax=Watersipora subatra TaxID=2589382 RepID=UPI00355B7721